MNLDLHDESVIIIGTLPTTRIVLPVQVHKMNEFVTEDAHARNEKLLVYIVPIMKIL